MLSIVMIYQTAIFFLILCQNTFIEAIQEFSNEWAVEIHGGNNVANEVAGNLGFINHGKILQEEDFYLFAHPKLRKRSIDTSEEHHSNLVSHVNVKWAQQQLIKRRVKRDLYDPQKPPNDPKWSQMWYLLQNTHPNMRVMEAWKAGFTGKNVSVTILDDGIEPKHPDLEANYDPLASGDINNHDSDPTPRLNPSNENRHGTRCAGEVAAVANNGICGVGIAYESKIGGVRMLDGQVTDAVEAASIGFNPDHVDIYSASWGPDDDGRTVDGPATLAKRAFVNGVKRGRDGKGSIFVWASGNGGRHEDNCNCDGYTDSIYTLSISSVTQRKTKPWYSESCSSTLASTYSSGSPGDHQIVTTDLRHGCTSSHTGTSASAPLAAAICALALEANPALTWRDMQHLVVQTSKPDDLNADDWVVNGVQRKVSHAFGYGLMDAYAMVTMARNWTLVPPQRRCTISVISQAHSPRIFTSNAPVIIPVQVAACDNGEAMVERLEHVQAELTLDNERRGDLEIYLISAAGTRSQLLGFRRPDTTSKGFNNWAFMTTHSWDEDPRGRWSLEVHDRNSRVVSGGYYNQPHKRPNHAPKSVKNSTLSHFNLILHGTKHSDWGASYKPNLASATAMPHATAKQQLHTTTTTASKGEEKASSNDNCRISSSIGCLVCNSPYVVDDATHLCTSSCPSGHYRSLIHVNEAGERKKMTAPRRPSVNYRLEVAEEQVFEDEERFYNGWICLSCAPYCHSCSGPLNIDCNQCMNGATFWANRSGCVPTVQLVTKERMRNVMYILIVVVLIVLALFVFLFYRSQLKSRACCDYKSSKFTYDPLFTGDETVEYHDEQYHDEDEQHDPKVSIKVNGIISDSARVDPIGAEPQDKLPIEAGDAAVSVAVKSVLQQSDC